MAKPDTYYRAFKEYRKETLNNKIEELKNYP